jgi:uncharacterized protein with PIN domain
MKFVVDAMLGKLALWLRLTGHDTEYSPTIEDDNALVIAKAEDRILLTSDEILYKRAVERDLGCMLVRGDVDQRISDVFIAYGMRRTRSKTSYTSRPSSTMMSFGTAARAIASSSKGAIGTISLPIQSTWLN